MRPALVAKLALRTRIDAQDSYRRRLGAVDRLDRFCNDTWVVSGRACRAHVAAVAEFET